MLRNFKIYSTPEAEIPFIKETYFASLFAEVTDEQDNVIGKQDDEIEVTLLDGRKNKRTAYWLTCLAYKTPFLEIDDILKLEARIIDETKSKPWIYNVGWKFPAEGIYCKQYPTYRYIPGCTKYAINESGDVVNVSTNTFKRAKEARNVYQQMRVVEDTGKSAAYMLHRLVGLAWLDYPMNFHELEINHKDRNVVNNHYTNLEWATRSANVVDAINKGLDISTCQVRNVLTGEVKEFNNALEASLKLNISKTMVNKIIAFGTTHAFLGKYQIRRKTDSAWIENPIIVNDFSDIPEENDDELICRDYRTGKTFSASSFYDMSMKTNIARSIIQRNIREKKLVAIRGFIIKEKADQRPFPELKGDDLEFAKVSNGEDRVVKVINTVLRQAKYFSSLTEACERLGIDRRMVSRRLNDETEVRYNHYVIQSPHLF